MNPFAPEVKACPYPFYEGLRAEHPVRWSPELSAWLVTSYEHAVAVLRDHRAFSSGNSIFGGPEHEHPVFPSIINADEPKHSQLRGLVAKAFAPRTLGKLWEPRIRELTTQLLDAVEGKEVFNVVADLAYPLPVTIIAEIIGVEGHRFAEFKEWSDGTIRRIGRVRPKNTDGHGPNAVRALGRKTRTAGRLVAAGDYAGLRARMVSHLRKLAVLANGRPGEELPDELGPLQAYFARAVADRRANPREDLVTRLVLAEIDGERLSDAEIIAFCVLLLVAGNETTTSLISTAVRALVNHPELMATLRARPALIDGLVEEALRWDAPIQGFYRRATVGTELAGQPIEAGDALLVLYAAANRDPARFARPADFDVERSDRGHISFGAGNHYCLGAYLARLEARVSLQAIVDRFETLTVVEGHEDAWRDTPFFRGLVEYPLRFTPR